MDSEKIATRLQRLALGSSSSTSISSTSAISSFDSSIESSSDDQESSMSDSSSSSGKKPGVESHSQRISAEINQQQQRKRGAWVEPRNLPAASRTLVYHQADRIEGNVPLEVKQLSFGYAAGRQVRFVRMDVQGPGWSVPPHPQAAIGPASSSSVGGLPGKREAQSVRFEAEIVVDKTMVNGNGMLHGGCIAYFVDNLGSVSLVALGLLRARPDSGVGVTQALNILFHAPAPIGSVITFVSTSLVLGRAMTARCEILHKSNGRLIASAFINKMEPKL